MAAPAEESPRGEVAEVSEGHSKSTAYVKPHGRLVAGNTEPLKAAVQPLLQRGGRVVIDCSELQYVDSMGLGAGDVEGVLGAQGAWNPGFGNLSPRIKELLRISKLTEYLARPDTINYGEYLSGVVRRITRSFAALRMTGLVVQFGAGLMPRVIPRCAQEHGGGSPRLGRQRVPAGGVSQLWARSQLARRSCQT